MPPNQTSVFGFAFSAISWASASPEPLSDMLTLTPVVLAIHGLDHVAPVGLHRADHVDLARLRLRRDALPRSSARPGQAQHGPTHRCLRHLRLRLWRVVARPSSACSALDEASYPLSHVLRPRSLRRHRRPHLAQADAGAVPGLSPRQAAAEGGRILAVARDELSDDGYRAWLKERFAGGRGRQAARPTRSSRASPPCCTTCASTCRSPSDYARLEGLARSSGRQAPTPW